MSSNAILCIDAKELYFLHFVTYNFKSKGAIHDG